MLDAGVGLTRVNTSDLKRALHVLHQGELGFPLSIGDLARVGLQHCSGDLLGLLRGLDERAVRAVLVAVLAERVEAEKRERVRAAGPRSPAPEE